MSLLNQVLRNLDSRHASDLERQRIPADVRPLPPMSASPDRAKWIIASTLAFIALAAAGIAVFTKWGSGRVESPPQAISQPPDIVIPLATPVQTETAAQAPPPAATTDIPADIPAKFLKLDMSEIFAFGREAKVEAKSGAEPPAQAEVRKSESSKAMVNEGVVAKTGKMMISPKSSEQEDGYRRALEQIERGNNANAEALLRQSLTINPAHQAARQSLFRLLIAERRVDDAATLLDEGLRIDASNAAWAVNLARLRVEQGNDAAAWEVLQRSLPYGSKQADYEAFCGTVLQRLKKFGESAEHYQQALRLNPAEGRWWIGLGLAYEADGKPKEAREAFQHAQSTGRLSPELETYIENKLR